ncbi:metallophosphoesterase family protein [Anaeromyxobacter diazotrophicus]|uniref:Metallophosphoesterase n=1 Tax=Anaeromyxobacter diazotrophicus TaxID=2590199 RepID=A0A7I9VKY1_9BACT|nr:metallophosphoesterase family protein [Anaeromyxobacter diazotrophicus]GEJ56838.1 metallophosphoesterase [Anaeromyxobacter diazotrophicus]
MRLALLADLHANLAAVEACLAHAAARGAEGHAFLGDLVGYGPEPAEVLELVAAHAARGAVVVGGNHDAAVVDGRTETMDPAAAEAVAWTRARLPEPARRFLAELPLVARREGALFVHASADAPRAWTYVSDPLRAAQSLAAAEATWVFCGHVHVPALYHLTAAGRAAHFAPVPGVAVPVPPHRRWLAVVGSAGQPRDGNPAACYALFDAAAGTLTFHRVPYDVRGAAARVRAAGLPERLARRLEHGK